MNKPNGMIIGIDASRAFLKRRTGIEEYSYQVIKHLRDTLPSDVEVVLYVRKKLSSYHGFTMVIPEVDFALPDNWRVRAIWAPRFWTQIGLSLEMLFHTPDVLFVPAHTVPLIHPKKTVVTIHGLEYEFCKEAYSFWERIYMHYSIMFSCQAASTVVCVSENTKKDVMKLYKVSEQNICVISEGYQRQATSNNQQITVSDQQPVKSLEKPYLLFIGRLEERKNVIRIIEAFEILKGKYQIPHELLLVGKAGYGYEKIRVKISDSRLKNEIREVGYVDEVEKWGLLKNADVFLFPTLYEGFGIPVLEAQSVGVPVVTSNVSSLPEVAGEGAIFVDPASVESIVEGVQKLLSDESLRNGIISKGRENSQRFSWQECATALSVLLKD